MIPLRINESRGIGTLTFIIILLVIFIGLSWFMRSSLIRQVVILSTPPWPMVPTVPNEEMKDPAIEVSMSQKAFAGALYAMADGGWDIVLGKSRLIPSISFIHLESVSEIGFTSHGTIHATFNIRPKVESQLKSGSIISANVDIKVVEVEFVPSVEFDKEKNLYTDIALDPTVTKVEFNGGQDESKPWMEALGREAANLLTNARNQKSEKALMVKIDLPSNITELQVPVPPSNPEKFALKNMHTWIKGETLFIGADL